MGESAQCPVPSDRGDSKAIRHVEWRIPTQQSVPKKTTPPMNHGGRINASEKHKKKKQCVDFGVAEGNHKDVNRWTAH